MLTSWERFLNKPRNTQDKTDEDESNQSCEMEFEYIEMSDSDSLPQDEPKIAESHFKFINAKSLKGKTILHKAVIHDNLDLTMQLSTNTNVKINALDDQGNTALHYAVQKNICDFSEALIHANASVQNKNNNGETPLHLAVNANSSANVKLLLENNVNMDVATNETMVLSSVGCGVGLCTPLHYAFMREIKNLNSNLILLFIEKNADFNKPDQLGRTPIYYAMLHSSLNTLDKNILQSLICRANLTIKTNKQETLLHAASRNENIPEEIFHQLVYRMARVRVPDLLNSPDSQGNTALFYAIVNKNSEQIKLLLEEGIINPNIWKNSSPLHEAIKNNDNSTAIKLLELGADANAQDNKKNTPLIYAASKGNLEMVECLKKYGANFQGPLGEVALKKSILNWHVDVTVKLIEYGANPAIHIYPSDNQNEQSASSIDLTKLKPSSRDGLDRTFSLSPGDTLLHFAVKSNDLTLAASCLAKKPEMVNMTNDHLNTPAGLAIKMLSPQMAHLLWEKGEEIQFTKKNNRLFSKASSYWNGEIRQKTLDMQAATRGFSSLEQVDEFFKDPNYKLTDMQVKIKQALENKYHPFIGSEVPRGISLAKIGLYNKPVVSRDQIEEISEADCMNENFVGQR